MTRHDYKLRLAYMLTNDPMSTAEIAVALGVARRTAQKMIAELSRELGVVKVGTKYAVHLETGWPWRFGAVETKSNETDTGQMASHAG